MAALFAIGATLAPSLGGCCNDVTTKRCVAADTSETCPARADAAEALDVEASQVKSDGTFWPAHAYELDGHAVNEEATCCYVVVQTVCTEELH